MDNKLRRVRIKNVSYGGAHLTLTDINYGRLENPIHIRLDFTNLLRLKTALDAVALELNRYDITDLFSNKVFVDLNIFRQRMRRDDTSKEGNIQVTIV